MQRLLTFKNNHIQITWYVHFITQQKQTNSIKVNVKEKHIGTII